MATLANHVKAELLSLLAPLHVLRSGRPSLRKFEFVRPWRSATAGSR